MKGDLTLRDIRKEFIGELEVYEVYCVSFMHEECPVAFFTSDYDANEYCEGLNECGLTEEDYKVRKIKIRKEDVA